MFRSVYQYYVVDYESSLHKHPRLAALLAMWRAFWTHLNRRRHNEDSFCHIVSKSVITSLNHNNQSYKIRLYDIMTVDLMKMTWKCIQVTVIKHCHCMKFPWVHLRFCISPLLCYQSHTVCLHLLVLYCNNSPSFCAHPHLFFFFFFFFSGVPFVHLFLCHVICENDLLAGPTLCLIDVACLIIVFLLFVFAHAVPKFLKYKKEKKKRMCHQI